MRIAYIISAYKHPEQLTRLVMRLKTDTTSFLVHIDSKTPNTIYGQMLSGLNGLSNVHLLRRHTCYWGGYGHVAATLEGMVELVQRRIDFDYAILLTGQDYPLRSNEQISAFFNAQHGKLFMEYFPLPRPEWQNGGMDRIEHWHFRMLGRHIMFPTSRNSPLKRRLPQGFRPFGGSSYWCLPRECVAYIDEFVRQNEKFVRFFRYVDVPDEIFFQTIILNSHFADRVVNDNLRYIEWRDLEAGSPTILRQSDFEHIVGSTKLFARKFDMAVDSDILDMIDERLLGWRDTCGDNGG